MIAVLFKVLIALAIIVGIIILLSIICFAIESVRTEMHRDEEEAWEFRMEQAEFRYEQIMRDLAEKKKNMQ